MNDRAVVFMLKAVFKYTENPASHETARKILLARATTGDPGCATIVKAQQGVFGGFMRAVCNGDFFDAYALADGSNKEALQIGMDRFLKPEYMGEASNLYDDGLEPGDYKEPVE
jgi:hypothetical protein